MHKFSRLLIKNIKIKHQRLCAAYRVFFMWYCTGEAGGGDSVVGRNCRCSMLANKNATIHTYVLGASECGPRPYTTYMTWRHVPRRTRRHVKRVNLGCSNQNKAESSFSAPTFFVKVRFSQTACNRATNIKLPS
jgi:hypothetical protein